MVRWPQDSPVTVFTLPSMKQSGREYYVPTRRPGLLTSIDGSRITQRGDHMPVTDAHTLERLRREEGLAEQKGRQALNIAAILKNHPQYDAARQKADALMAQASALREQIVKIETQ
jgi:hypothetical protein